MDQNATKLRPSPVAPVSARAAVPVKDGRRAAHRGAHGLPGKLAVRRPRALQYPSTTRAGTLEAGSPMIVRRYRARGSVVVVTLGLACAHQAVV